MGSIKTLDQLNAKRLCANGSAEELQRVVDKFSLSITDEMVRLIDPCDANDPIARQFIPSAKELHLLQEELEDPIGDDVRSPVKGIVHRYPDRCLLIPLTVCPVYCRFCFRREKVSSPEKGLNNNELEAAFQYIENTKEIWEVILTGGDPLFMAPSLMRRIVQRLSAIDHVEVLRIHSRVPIVDPGRVNERMLEALETEKALYIALHANHVKEFSGNAKEAIAKIVDAGIPMLGQTVLLKGVNDDAKVLEALFREMVKNRVKPYYLHHGDHAKGTSHFRTTIQEGQQLLKQLRGRLSGLCQPTYALDLPGGHGKVPINPNYLTVTCEKGDKTEYAVENYQGNFFSYSC